MGYPGHCGIVFAATPAAPETPLLAMLMAAWVAGLVGDDH